MDEFITWLCYAFTSKPFYIFNELTSDWLVLIKYNSEMVGSSRVYLTLEAIDTLISQPSLQFSDFCVCEKCNRTLWKSNIIPKIFFLGQIFPRYYNDVYMHTGIWLNMNAPFLAGM